MFSKIVFNFFANYGIINLFAISVLDYCKIIHYIRNELWNYCTCIHQYVFTFTKFPISPSNKRLCELCINTTVIKDICQFPTFYCLCPISLTPIVYVIVELLSRKYIYRQTPHEPLWSLQCLQREQSVHL